ncbi:histidine kinase [Mycobacteroides abscessus subsp. massiliense]|nr:histidine kinase [Mycobacteroides abscessus subsp. massiliense]SKD98809.1 histidine kinase [Mycobacteroides abscessus subsp. massiliense]SKE71572.1 histidine kinase [Mycobacteroides abscessus subsp. massiliense]SKE89395.1 histidine kinase [Mycobacteroides abscessus subsp. massiliense]SKE97993.1 histidine kinase [Mycobacteroides abscessus subsp. massiliense]
MASGETDVVEEIFISDNGSGMPPDQVEDFFLTHGESWKRNARFSPDKSRPLHGRFGRGRFLGYAVADKISWTTVASRDGEFTETVIIGRQSAPDEFDFTSPIPVGGPTGTTVHLVTRQIPKVVALTDPGASLQLVATLAPSLLALPDVVVNYRGNRLKPQDHIISDNFLDLAIDTRDLHGLPQPQLRLVEWSSDMRAKTLFLCDERGNVITEYRTASLPPAPISWTAYLQWEGFRDPDLMSGADLRVPEIRHGALIHAAEKSLSQYLEHRLNEQKGRIIAEWIEQGVYPYQGNPRNAAEEVERDVFDIVAVVASPAIGKGVKQKKLSLRLLQEATRAEPSRTNKILTSVLDLSDEEQQVLVELLERTKLASIIKSAQTIADRADFIHGLRSLLYTDPIRKEFREVDQLHPMLVNEPWIFGDEWNLALSEVGLTRLVKTLVLEHESDAEFATSPVVLPSGKKGRVDMVFSRHLPDSERTRHLVVELKRPKTIRMAEFSQVTNYASAIVEHPEVIDSPHTFDFWLIGTEIDNSVRHQYSDPSRPGLTTNNDQYRLWVMSWGQLLDQAERRIQAFQDALELSSSDVASRQYLQRKHAEFVPDKTSPDHPNQ